MPGQIEIHNPLCKYLSGSSLGYAVMIDGAWGSGKTYYVKNVLKDCTEKKWVYVSLFGLSSSEQIDDAIGSELMALPDSGLLKAGGEFFAKYFSTENSAGLAGSIAAATGKWARGAVLKAIGENHVLVLDDLERFNNGKDISDALASTSRYAEIQGASVIIVGDLTKLNSQQLAYEEKAVRYTFRFRQAYKDIWMTGIGAFKKNVKFFEFLQSLSESMSEKLKSIECANIRTLMVALGAVELLFDQYEKDFLGHVSHVERLILEALYYAKVKAEKRTDYSDFENFIRNPVSFWMRVHREQEKNKANNARTLLKQIADQFPGTEAQYPSLWDLLKNGIIDDELFEREIKEWLPAAKVSDFDLVTNLYSHKDAKECDQAISNILAELKTKTLTFSTIESFFELCVLLDRLSETNSLPCSESDLRKDLLEFINTVGNEPSRWFDRVTVLASHKGINLDNPYFSKTPNRNIYKKELIKLWEKVKVWRFSFDTDIANGWLDENPPNWEELERSYSRLPILCHVDYQRLKAACDSSTNHKSVRQAHLFFMRRAEASFENRESELPVLRQLHDDLKMAWLNAVPSVINEPRSWLLQSIEQYIAQFDTQGLGILSEGEEKAKINNEHIIKDVTSGAFSQVVIEMAGLVIWRSSLELTESKKHIANRDYSKSEEFLESLKDNNLRKHLS